MFYFSGRARQILIAAVASVGLVTASNAAILDFESQTNGKIVKNQYTGYAGGITVTADNFRVGGPDLAIVFDTRKTNTRDPDLEGPNWASGNLRGVVEGNILIIAENSTDANHDGLIDQPDDEGAKPPGEITFKFKQPQASIGFDLIDVDGPIEWDDTRGFFSFLKDSHEVGRVRLPDFITPSSPFFDPTVVYHDNSANRIKPISMTQFGGTSFDTLVANYGWCMGLDNLNFTPFVVPEPTAALASIACAGLMIARRREAARGSLN
jgi:hypothetical protein